MGWVPGISIPHLVAFTRCAQAILEVDASQVRSRDPRHEATPLHWAKKAEVNRASPWLLS